MWWDNVDTSELHKNTKKVKENNTKRWRRFDFWRALKERVALRWAEWEGRERAFCPSFPSLLLPCLYVDKVERRRPVSAAKSEKHVCFLSHLVCYFASDGLKQLGPAVYWRIFQNKGSTALPDPPPPQIFAHFPLCPSQQPVGQLPKGFENRKITSGSYYWRYSFRFTYSLPVIHGV